MPRSADLCGFVHWLTSIFPIFFLFANLNACEGIFVKVCQWQNQGTSLLNKQSAPKPFQKKDEISHTYIFCELRFI